MGISNREEQARRAGDGRGIEQPAVEGGREPHGQGVPEQAMEMLQNGRIGPEGMVEHVRQRRERPGEVDEHAGAGPPGRKPGIAHPGRRICGHESEKVPQRPSRGPLAPAEQHIALEVVVHRETHAQCRQRENEGQHGEEERMGQQHSEARGIQERVRVDSSPSRVALASASACA